MLPIIVISYNTKNESIKCLRSIFSETRTTPFELIVLDNASTDGSAIAVQAEFGEVVRLIQSSRNFGFAVGNNIAATYAQGEFLLLLNPDTVVLDGAIDKLMRFAESHPQSLIWGGRTLFADGSLNPASCWMQQTTWSLVSQLFGFSSLFRKSTFFNPEGIGGWDRRGIKEVDIVSGCFFLIRRELWDKLNGFHPEFFMYGEEADLCLRAKQFGAQPLVSSEATIIHYGGASEKNQADKIVRLLQAKMLLIRRHFPEGQKRIGTTLLAGWPLTRYLSHSVAAFLGRKASRERKQMWRNVWNKRSEWHP